VLKRTQKYRASLSRRAGAREEGESMTTIRVFVLILISYHSQQAHDALNLRCSR